MEPVGNDCCSFATAARETLGAANPLTCVIPAAVSFRFLLRHIACIGLSKSGLVVLGFRSFLGLIGIVRAFTQKIDRAKMRLDSAKSER